MKKPKKAAAAKPRTRQKPSSRAKTRVSTAKAETATAPTKAAVKRVRKVAAAAVETAQPIEPEPAAKPVIEAKPAIEAKRAVEPKPMPEPAQTIAHAPEVKQIPRLARKAPAKIPPILLEGDKPEAISVSGPGQRYALGPSAPAEKFQTEGHLPESYGTGAILLAARDPHWLYCHWDLSSDQQRRYNSFSRDGHMVVRVYAENPDGKPATEVHVHPESRHWFVHVGRANTRYVAQLGYYSASERWTAVSTSAATLTPPDAVSADTSAEFSTIPFEVPMEKLLSLVKEAVHENAPLAQALQELRANGHAALPQSVSSGKKSARWTPSEWTPAQERALAEVVSMDHVRRVWMGSLEITELIRRQFVHEQVSAAAGEFGALAPGAPTSPAGAVTGISSPTAGRVQLPKGFWFDVNAELIVYGATEPDASVTIGGRKIKLRPDGSFSYRFALPDGNYEMPVVAISADETDGRAAEMKFSRDTEYRGHVGAHPQDPALQQLLLENF